MNKKNVLIAIVFMVFGLLILSGCTELTRNDTFTNYNIGEHFGGNRDGYLVKLNNSFFANITYKNECIEIYKLLDTASSDFFGNSELYYSGNISECYCNNSNLIVYSSANKNYVMIDCNNINNTQSFTEAKSTGIELSKLSKIVLNDSEA